MYVANGVCGVDGDPSCARSNELLFIPAKLEIELFAAFIMSNDEADSEDDERSFSAPVNPILDDDDEACDGDRP